MNLRQKENIGLHEVFEKGPDIMSAPAGYINYNIDEETQKEVILGGLNTISYDKKSINLIIVPVNEAASFSASQFTTKLNEIYQQSVVEWKVTLDDVFEINESEWDLDGDHKMNDGESTFLSDYSDEQLALKRKYKQERDIDKQAYYVFLLNNIPSKSGLAGYMPLKKQYAYIHSATDENAAQLIAHELGHGAFRLWHTFSSNSDYFMPRKTSDNLMDYNDGERLHKYQWDLIHNPEGGLYLFQDEEEAAYIDPAYLSMESINVGNNPDETENAYTCLTPAGIPITIIDGVASLNFTTRYSDKIADGALTGFKNNDGNYVGLYNISENKFLGYALIINPSATAPIDRV